MFSQCLVTEGTRTSKGDALGTFSRASASQRLFQKPDFGSEGLASELQSCNSLVTGVHQTVFRANIVVHPKGFPYCFYIFESLVEKSLISQNLRLCVQRWMNIWSFRLPRIICMCWLTLWQTPHRWHTREHVCPWPCSSLTLSYLTELPSPKEVRGQETQHGRASSCWKASHVS